MVQGGTSGGMDALHLTQPYLFEWVFTAQPE